VNAAHTAMAAPMRIALLGNPNCGKTALFNLLTGSRQKVANYAGVTVERKEGHLQTASGRRVLVLDLPGAYSLNPLSADEAVTRDVVSGRRADEPLPDLLVCVVDATNLKLNLRLVLEARALGLPMILTLNMSDMAVREGIVIDRGSACRGNWPCLCWRPSASGTMGRRSCWRFWTWPIRQVRPAIWPPPRRRHPGMRRTWRR
jgi:ferrous iron transport protein B